MDAIRTVVAEDHDGVRYGLLSLLSKDGNQIEVVGEARSGSEALRLCEQFSPDVLLLDLKLPDMNGIEVASQLQSAGSSVRILVISAFLGREFKNSIMMLFKCGISGCITKDEVIEWLIPAIQSIARGEQWFSPMLQGYLSEP